MGRFSILPESLSGIETGFVYLFLCFAALTIGPWIAFLMYDAVLYLWRIATYEIPFIGGRARGKQRPRAPSLTERPDGHRRRMSIAGLSRRRSNSIAKIPPWPHDKPPIISGVSTGRRRSSSSAVPRAPTRLREEAE